MQRLFMIGMLCFGVNCISCGQASFTGGAGKKSSADGSKRSTGSQTFAVSSSSQRALDLVWVVDTSGSMDNEIELVKENMQFFLDNILADQSDTKMAVIGQTEDSSFHHSAYFDIDLNTGSLPVFRINKSPVGSTNGLAFATAATCAKEPTNYDSESRTLCGQDITDIYATIEDGESLGNFTGTLHDGFLRKDSQKLYVFVTDDDAAGVLADDFFKMTQLSKDETHVYAFAAQSQSDCSISNVGTEYEKLAAATGGKVYDVCSTDWKEHFSDLAGEVLKLTKSQFEISDVKFKGVVKVLGDDNVISPSEYKVSGNSIKFADTSLLKSIQKVTIVYEKE